MYSENSTINYAEAIYSYNGSETMPFKTIVYFPGQDTTITYHYYDNQLKKTRDSIISNATAAIPYIIVNRYSYNSNGFVVNLFRNKPGNFTLYNDYRDSATLDGTGNIISYKEYESFPTNAPFTLKEIVNITYDNKPNPLARLSNLRAADFVIGGEPYSIQGFPQINNPVRFFYTFPVFSTTDDIRTDYTYNANNFPTVGRTYRFPASGAYAGKEIYVYKAL